MAATRHFDSTGTTARPPRPAPAPAPQDRQPRHTPVRDLMNRQVVAVNPWSDYTTVLAAVRDQHHDLLPVVDDQNRLTGLITASDLLAKLALTALPPHGTRFETRGLRALRRKGAGVVARDDTDIRCEILALAVADDVDADRPTLRVDCDRGRILLTARTARRSQADTLLDRVRAVEGVVDVAPTLTWDSDDLARPRTAHQR